MNERKIYFSNKRTKRTINALFVFYIVLCFCFLGLFRHIVDSHAESETHHIIASAGLSTCDCEIGVNNGRGCFLKLGDENEIEYISSKLGYNVNGGYIYLGSPYSSQIYNLGVATQNIGFAYWTTNSGYATNDIASQGSVPNNFTCFYRCFPFFTQDSINVSWSPDGDIPYVEGWQDAYKYLVNGDTTVLKHGDPVHPTEVEDGSIPTPQKVKILDDGVNPAVVWQNPKKALEFGDKLKMEIEFKPTINFSWGLSFTDTVVATIFQKCFDGLVNNHNGFCIRKDSGSNISNDYNGYNMLFDDKYIFDINPASDYDNSYVKFVLQDAGVSLTPYGVGTPPVSSGSVNTLSKGVKAGGGGIPDAVWDTLAPEVLSQIKGLFDVAKVGTCDYRMRYYVMDGNKKLVSPWVNAVRKFNNNERAEDDTNVSFTDKDENPITNPSYLPADSYSSKDSTTWLEYFLNTTETVFQSVGEMARELTSEESGIYAFFRQLFDEFPMFYAFLGLGMGLCIVMRILGR